MSQDLLHIPSKYLRQLTLKFVPETSAALPRKVFPEPPSEAQKRFLERISVTSTEFKASAEQLQVFEAYPSKSSQARQSPITDMHSVFFILLTFCLRVNIRGLKPPDELLEKSERLFCDFQRRSEANIAGLVADWVRRLEEHADGNEYCKTLFETFGPLLRDMAYFSTMPFATSGLLSEHQFVMHDFIQGRLLPVIIKLKDNNIPIVGDSPLSVVGCQEAAMSTLSLNHPSTGHRLASDTDFDSESDAGSNKRRKTGGISSPSEKERRTYERMKGLGKILPSRHNKHELDNDGKLEIVNRFIIMDGCGCELDCSLVHKTFQNTRYMTGSRRKMHHK